MRFILFIILLLMSTLAFAQFPTKTPSKISYPVQMEIEQCKTERAAGIKTLLNGEDAAVRVSEQGEILLVFHSIAATGSEQSKQLESLGARVVYVLETPTVILHAPVGMIHAWMPFDMVEVAAALPWVAAVTAPDDGETNTHPNNPIDSEGVQLHNADLAYLLGVTGAGVNVGAISDGVTNLAASQALNELPAVNVIAVGGGDEGTAMLEHIHDMAPGASLLFHATGGGTAGHVTALTNLVVAGANVISEDLAYDSEPAFQQGVVATARENAAIAGVPVHSSSGNRGTNHTARVLATGTGNGPDGYGGPFVGCAISPTNVVAIAPGGDTTFDMTVGTNTRFTLQWSEPRAIFPTAGAGGFTDLDLYVMDSTGTQCLAVSTASQGGGLGDTIERISTSTFGIPSGTPVKVVVNVSGTLGAAATPILDLRWRGSASQQDLPTRAGSNDPDKNYTGLAYVIGAVNAGSGLLEGFSSAGPVDLTLTTICPGGAMGFCGQGVPGSSASYQGLDFLGADGTSISGVGGFGSGTCPAVDQGDCRFFGTSAAAPHSAACDALVRSLPSFGASVAPATTRARLAATAQDFPPAGEDSTNGAGLLDCLAAIGPPEANCQIQIVPTDPGVCFATGVSVDNGSSDPFGQAIGIVESPEDPYSLGSTLVNLTVTDADGLTAMCNAWVTVLDHEPPTITAPENIQKECEAPGGTPVDLGVPTGVLDNCDADLAVTNDAPGLFPLGLTTVTWTATDDSLNSTDDTQNVTIVDTTPPEIFCNAVDITPADTSISFTASAVDECQGPVTAEITDYDCFKLTKKGKLVNKTDSCVVSFSGDQITILDSGGVSDIIKWTVTAADDNGNSTTQSCKLNVTNPGN